MSKGLWGVLALVGVVGAAIGWFLFSPLLFDEVIDEGFPTPAQVNEMSEPQRAAAMDLVMTKMAQMPDVAVSDEMPVSQAPMTVRTGAFKGADALHQAEGMATQYRLPTGGVLVRFEAFTVTNGPALVVYLAKNPAPKTAGDVLAGFHSLGKLKGNKGNQNYEIPTDVDLAEFGSVVVWCELFDVLFAVAPLAAPLEPF